MPLQEAQHKKRAKRQCLQGHTAYMDHLLICEGPSRSFPHASPQLGSQEVSRRPERMKCLPIVLPNYYVFNISMTKMPLDFSSIHSAERPLSPALIKHFAAHHGCKAPTRRDDSAISPVFSPAIFFYLHILSSQINSNATQTFH
ncbi:hypothetical protein ATANTOWER_017589 [Ataeniobius toweri]|uniref:Uncharacterized protein n=1 Tax=Ataeniobius toweri TaxID=208326 RepID=A0ABU7ATH5_9TELE|nr:hypothetical protein [Ataeniobius toweri]